MVKLIPKKIAFLGLNSPGRRNNFEFGGGGVGFLCLFVVIVVVVADIVC